MDKKQQSNTTQKKNKIKENEKRVLVSAQRITDIKSINDDVEILTLNSAWKIFAKPGKYQKEEYVIFFQYDSVIHEDLQNKINIPEFDSEEIKYMEGPIEKIAIVVKQSFLENDLYSDGFIISNADIKCDELKKYFSENSLKELHEKKVNLSEIFDIKKSL
jgi:hypothetical protein